MPGVRPTARASGAAVLLVLTAISLVLHLPHLLHPAMDVEDGFLNFPFFFEHPQPSSLLRSISGYVPVAANLLGWLSVRLPVEWIPHGFAWSSWLLNLAAVLAPLHPRMTALGSRSMRRVLALVLAALPCQTYHHAVVTSYTIWPTFNVLILCACFMRRPTPVMMAVIAASAWTHPLSICTLPVFAWRWWSGRRRFDAFMCLNLLAHQWLGITGTGRLLGDGGLAFLSLAAGSIPNAGLNAAHAVTRATVGPDAAAWIHSVHPAMAGAFALAAGIPVALWLWRTPRLRLAALSALVIMAGTSYLFVLSRGGAALELLPNAGTRYKAPQQTLWLLLTFLAARDLTRRLPRPDAVRAALLAAWAGAWLASPSVHWPYAPAPAENALVARRFFTELGRLRDTCPDSYPVLRGDRAGDWDLVSQEPWLGRGPRPEPAPHLR